MNYEEIINKIQSQKRFGKAYGRDVTAEMMDLLGHPEKDMNIIHIAGTNGKGSTAAFVSSILQAADFVVGQFTSPHLVRFTERIKVSGVEIDQESVVTYAQQIMALPMENEPTMFDICLGIAILYFKDMNCDFVVLETGLGGAKDSTAGLSVVPLVCAFTNIGFDHTAILGDTIEAIASEKAGILKSGTEAVVGVMDTRASEVIENVALSMGVEIHFVDNLLTNISTYKIGLKGEFQRENAALATGIVETVFNIKSGYLLDKFFEISKSRNNEKCTTKCNGICQECEEEYNPYSDFVTWKEYVIKTGLARAYWPGRMEIISQNPFIMVDGAHNPQGVEALFNSLKIDYPDEKFTFITAVMADKDYMEMMSIMKPIARRFITATVDYSRSKQGQDLAEELKAMGCEATCREDFADALKLAMEYNEKIIIFGSLYFVGEVLEQYAKD
ncbi:MAG: bifunctional folylpolyglutamate synthase/dihydrofolate synthase [Lachnospiraceae bacterium]|nr:bifunctional folylpolyglutamate synthase/dihydrofolate synthase [Lachnospiraceae bacterium]